MAASEKCNQAEGQIGVVALFSSFAPAARVDVALRYPER